jgi:hypothetical protein
MKITMVTDGKGKLVASMFEETSREPTGDGPSATLRPGPGQVFEEVDVSDDYAKLSPDDLHRELRKLVSTEAK